MASAAVDDKAVHVHVELRKADAFDALHCDAGLPLIRWLQLGRP
jgi:hypothetical protein